jgi:hypothetical protein
VKGAHDFSAEVAAVGIVHHNAELVVAWPGVRRWWVG